MKHQNTGDNHNAPVFHWCYQADGRFTRVIAKVQTAASPCWTIFTRYRFLLATGSGKWDCNDVFAQPAAELPASRVTLRPWNGWLPWGHAMAAFNASTGFIACMSVPGSALLRPSLAWKRWTECAALSPAEMALPNHPGYSL